MNSKKVMSAILAASLSTGGFAFAQENGDRNDRGRNEQRERGDQQDRRDDQNRRDDRDRHDEQVRQWDHRDNRAGDRGNEDRREERGAGPQHAFHRGERLPVEYRHRQYVVDDWRSHNLSAPPRGYHWVQTGGDYVLAAIATGVIVQLFLNN